LFDIDDNSSNSFDEPKEEIEETTKDEQRKLFLQNK